MRARKPGSLSSIARPSLGVTVALALVALMELARDALVIQLFGRGETSDAFFLAIALPLAVGGGLHTVGTQTLMPWFCALDVRDPSRCRQYMSQIFYLILGLTLGMAALARPLGSVLTTWMAGPSINQALLCQLLQLTVPTMGLMGASAVLEAFLNSQDVYGVVTAKQALDSAVFIGLLLTWRRGESAFILGLAYLLGRVAELLWAVWLARPLPRYLLVLRDGSTQKDLVELLRSIALPSFTVVAGRQLLTVERVIAGYFAVGSVATVSYVRRVTLALARVLSVGVSVVVRSRISRAHASDSSADGRRVFEQGFRLLLLILVPLMVVVIALRVQIARVLFFGSQLSPADLREVSTMFAGFAGGIPTVGVVPVALAFFFARGDTVTPSLQQLGVVAVNFVLDLALARAVGLVGIALASPVSAAVSVLSAMWLVERLEGKFAVWRDWRFLARLSIGGVFAACSAAVASSLAGSMRPIGPLGLFAELILGSVSGLLVFLASGALLKVDEILRGLSWLRGTVLRLRRQV